jgi:hypothetical protein
LFSEVDTLAPLPAEPMVSDAGGVPPAMPAPIAADPAPPAVDPAPPAVEVEGPTDAGPSAGDAGAAPMMQADAGQSPGQSVDVAVPVRPPAGVVVSDASEACTFPEAPPADSVLFSGTREDDACRINLEDPYATFWYAYQDTGAEPGVSQSVLAPGCTENSCSLHVQGPIEGTAPFSLYGAGVGFPLVAGDAEFDASSFSGIQYWARGNIEGTRGPGNTASPQTLFLKVTSATERAGDDFGRYCRIDATNWTLCRQEFAELERDGYVASPDPATDTLELSQLVRIQFEFPLHRDASGAAPVPVRFDIELAAISFF